MGEAETAVMIDTSLLVAYYSTTDRHHARAKEIVDEVQDGRHGAAFVSDHILAEALNYFVAKSRDVGKPDRIARDLLGEDSAPWIDIVFIDEVVWRQARERYRTLSRARVSFTDCTTLVFAERHALKAVISFDDDFDGLLPRIS